MPGSGTPLLWNELSPSETDIADAAPIRSLETSLRNGLAVEHNWPAASGSNFGYHLLGSCRPYYDVQSNVSSSGTDARLLVTSDTSRLFHVGSTGTLFLGGQTVLSVGSSPTGGQKFYWATEFGEARTSNIVGTVFVTFPNSGFSGRPFITIGILEPPGLASYPQIVLPPTDVGPVGFTANSVSPSSGLSFSAVSFFWMSMGTRTF